MVLDVRAKVICNLGPVISGSVKDDHVQGQGLVMTTGELVIAGLVTPAHGDVVKLAYITPDETKAARFPRGPFYVTKAFADPLRNQTQISIADKLAYEKGKGGGTINSSLVDGLNGRIPKTAKSLELREAFELLADRIGLQVEDAGSWSINKQVAFLNSQDYIETMSDMLASATHFGFLNSQGKLVAQSYKELDNNGPVIGFDQVIDLTGNQGGLDFVKNPTGSGTAQTVKDEEPDDAADPIFLGGIYNGSYGSFGSEWDRTTATTITSIKLTLKDGTTTEYPVVESVESIEITAEPDNRVLERTAVTSTSLVKVNSQVIQDYKNANQLGPDPQRKVLSRKSDYYTYQEIPPEPLSEDEKAKRDQEVQSAIDQLIAANADQQVINKAKIIMLPKLPTYRVIREESVETMSYIEALGRIGVRDYTKMSGLPDGQGIKQRIVTDILYTDTKQKRIEYTYVAYGLTQMGQQAISAAAFKATTGADFAPFVRQFFDLVLEDAKVQILDLNLPEEEKPIPDYLAKYANADAVIQGDARIQVGDDQAQRSNSAGVFDVPFLPDDVVNDDGTVSKGGATTSAANYAEEQNRLLLGHRLGLQVTTALGVLPNKPLNAFHLRNNGISATYRTNGTAWSFDSNSCLVSTDALYWGLAGGDISGPRWTPVAPGTSALPAPPADVDNGPQDPVNSVTLVEPVDVSDSAAVTTLIDSLPDDETEVFETELTPVALALPFKLINTMAMQVRLQLETLLVPLGINRSMGEATLQSVLQLEAVQEISEQVVLELESAESNLLAETFSAGLGLGGNLS